MIRLAEVIHHFKADLLARYTLSDNQKRALTAMQRCRSSASPKILTACTACEHRSVIPHSCGHRHCPHCQHHESQQWLERQTQRLVPAHYFLLTFTLPAEFRTLAAAHQNAVYELLMRCGWQTLHQFAQNDKHLQGVPGAIAVLHTHTRRLDYHPHVHWVVPAAAVHTDAQGKKHWRTKAPRNGKETHFLFHHKALAKVFRAKILAGLKAAGIALPTRHPKQWVLDCKAVGLGQPALTYLGRYLYRGVIREDDILSCKDGQVCFRYCESKTKKMRTRTMLGADFLWLILQHVLPKGFRRARNFGFLHPNRKSLIALLQLVLSYAPKPAAQCVKERAPIICQCCGALMQIIATRLKPNDRRLIEITLPRVETLQAVA